MGEAYRPARGAPEPMNVANQMRAEEFHSISINLGCARLAVVESHRWA